LCKLCTQKHRKDIRNFDKQFTTEKAELTTTDKLFMMNLDQTEFNGFSFLNPEFFHIFKKKIITLGSLRLILLITVNRVLILF